MSLLDAVRRAGPVPGAAAPQATKKRYSEVLSKALAEEVAAGLRQVGFPNVKPVRGGPGEREFQGGLGPKKVDVSHADERHGLLLALSVKSICFPPYGKNLKNRFGDLCTEAITLHMRFPYSVVCALFAMPVAADADTSRWRPISTFRRAAMLLGTISDRQDYTSAGEKFEQVTMLLFRPVGPAPAAPATRESTVEGRVAGEGEPVVRLFVAGPSAAANRELTEDEYFVRLRDIYNVRNPHAQVGVEHLKAQGEDLETETDGAA